ncbi:MAG TPA: hypothetical protein PK350_09985 [Deltaproteobacteria bacterium]|nr:hypothetical protein [Deltaproteobacteria bacterium]
MKAGLLCAILLVCWSGTLIAGQEPERSTGLYEGLQEKVLYSRSDVTFPGGSYTFRPVLQGIVIRHTFIVHNDSGRVLGIERIKACSGSGCAMVVEDRSREIAPHKAGAVTVRIRTGLVEGTGFDEAVVLFTNNKEHPSIILRVRGDVIRFARVEPRQVRLAGQAGKEIRAELLVVPEEAYPFRITGIRARRGKDIAYAMEETVRDGRRAYVITVRNTRKGKGVYSDVLFLRTDREEMPELRVSVIGEIMD